MKHLGKPSLKWQSWDQNSKVLIPDLVLSIPSEHPEVKGKGLNAPDPCPAPLLPIQFHRTPDSTGKSKSSGPPGYQDGGEGGFFSPLQPGCPSPRLDPNISLCRDCPTHHPPSLTALEPGGSIPWNSWSQVRGPDLVLSESLSSRPCPQKALDWDGSEGALRKGRPERDLPFRV